MVGNDLAKTLNNFGSEKTFANACRSWAGSFVASTNQPVATTSPERKDKTMKVMVIVKATKNSEAGILPSEKLLTNMGKFNEELVNAGVMLAGDGLHPSVKGKRVMISGSKRTVVDGPFAETKELIAGYWIWQVRSMDEAVEWARRCPEPMPGEEMNLELRPIFEADDFGEALTPELRANEERLRAQVNQKKL